MSLMAPLQEILLSQATKYCAEKRRRTLIDCTILKFSYTVIIVCLVKAGQGIEVVSAVP